jgi:hypothetical protein
LLQIPGLQQLDNTKAQLQSLRFGLALFLVMWTGKIPKGRVNSGFLSELSLDYCCYAHSEMKWKIAFA